jgi:hypothetical protein
MKISLRNLSQDAFNKILALDQSFVGTPDYLGIAFFWTYEYRHYMRDTTVTKRRRAHAALVKAGLPLMGESAAHLAIMVKYGAK